MFTIEPYWQLKLASFQAVGAWRLEAQPRLCKTTEAGGVEERMWKQPVGRVSGLPKPPKLSKMLAQHLLCILGFLSRVGFVGLGCGVLACNEM